MGYVSFREGNHIDSFIRQFIGVISLLITSRGPLCTIPGGFFVLVDFGVRTKLMGRLLAATG